MYKYLLLSLLPFCWCLARLEDTDHQLEERRDPYYLSQPSPEAWKFRKWNNAAYQVPGLPRVQSISHFNGLPNNKHHWNYNKLRSFKSKERWDDRNSEVNNLPWWVESNENIVEDIPSLPNKKEPWWVKTDRDIVEDVPSWPNKKEPWWEKTDGNIVEDVPSWPNKKEPWWVKTDRNIVEDVPSWPNKKEPWWEKTDRNIVEDVPSWPNKKEPWWEKTDRNIVEDVPSWPNKKEPWRVKTDRNIDEDVSSWDLGRGKNKPCGRRILGKEFIQHIPPQRNNDKNTNKT